MGALGFFLKKWGKNHDTLPETSLDRVFVPYTSDSDSTEKS
jgi:hypothetical protein